MKLLKYLLVATLLFLTQTSGQVVERHRWTGAATDSNTGKWTTITILDSGGGKIKTLADGFGAFGNIASPNTGFGGAVYDSLMHDTSMVGIVLGNTFTYSGSNTSLYVGVAQAKTGGSGMHGYRARIGPGGTYGQLQLQITNEGFYQNGILGTVNLSSAATSNDTLWLKFDSVANFQGIFAHAGGVRDTTATVNNTTFSMHNAYIVVRGYMVSPANKLQSLVTASIKGEYVPPPPPPDTEQGIIWSDYSHLPATVNDYVRVGVTAADSFHVTKVVALVDSVRVDSATFPAGSSVANYLSDSLATGARGAWHVYWFEGTTDSGTFVSDTNGYWAEGDTVKLVAQSIPTKGNWDSVAFSHHVTDFWGLTKLTAIRDGARVDSISYSPAVTDASWTSKYFTPGTLDSTHTEYVEVVTDSAKTVNMASQTYYPTQTPYWHTAYYSNWEYGDVSPHNLPWSYITHLVQFAGTTRGAQTNGTYPYWFPPDNFQIDSRYPSYSHIGDSLRACGTRYNVKILLDLGFNSSNQFFNLCAKGDTAIQTWAGQVAHYMVDYGYDGADFDAEGGSYPSNPVLSKSTGGMGRMANLLHDSLLALNPSKEYDITTIMTMYASDVAGFIDWPNYGSYFAQVNAMFYDVSGSFGSPLYKDSSCWVNRSDSGAAAGFVAQGVPKEKVGLGYNIQVYHTATTVGCPPGGFGYISKLMNEIQYFPPASGASVYWNDVVKQSYMINTVSGVKVGYEDSVSAWHKANFIKRNGYGGIAGFTIGRGYLPSPPVGWYHHTAVQGVGQALFNGMRMPSTPAPGTPILSTPADDSIGVPVVATLEWQASSGATSYWVQVSTDSTFVTTNFNSSTVTGTTYNFGGASLVSNTDYYWRVSATNGASWSNFSAPFHFKTVLLTPPVPALVSPADQAMNQPLSATFVWRSSWAAATYHLQVADISDFTNLVYNDSTLVDTSQAVGTFLNNTTYYWRVRAKNATGTSGWATYRTMTTVPLTPNVPTLALPTDTASGRPVTLSLQWDPAARAVTYRVQVSTDSTFTTTAVDDSTVSATLLAVGPLSEATTYYWHVNAKNGGGTSAWSTRWSFTTTPPLAGGADTIPPVATITAPVDGDTVGASFIFSVSATDNRGVQRVEFFVNHVPVFTDYTAPFTVTVNTAGIAANPFQAYAIAYDSTGNFDVATAVTVHKTPVPSKTTLVSPADSATETVLPITFKWRMEPYVDHYVLEVGYDSLFAVRAVNDSTLTDTSYALSGVRNGDLWWRVTTINHASGTAGATTKRMVTVNLAAPVVDVTPPVAVLIIPSGGVVLGGTDSMTVTYIATDNDVVAQETVWVKVAPFTDPAVVVQHDEVIHPQSTTGTFKVYTVPYRGKGLQVYMTAYDSSGNSMTTTPQLVTVLAPPVAATFPNLKGYDITAIRALKAGVKGSMPGKVILYTGTGDSVIVSLTGSGSITGDKGVNLASGTTQHVTKDLWMSGDTVCVSYNGTTYKLLLTGGVTGQVLTLSGGVWKPATSQVGNALHADVADSLAGFNPASKAASAHNHTASDISTGIFTPQRLGNGTPNGHLTILYGDGWGTAPAGISGTLSLQAPDDLTDIIGARGYSVSYGANYLNFIAYNGTPVFKLDYQGKVTVGTWQGSPLADAYISSAATWSAKLAPADTNVKVPGMKRFLDDMATKAPTVSPTFTGSVTTPLGAGTVRSSAGGVLSATTSDTVGLGANLYTKLGKTDTSTYVTQYDFSTVVDTFSLGGVGYDSLTHTDSTVFYITPRAGITVDSILVKRTGGTALSIMVVRIRDGASADMMASNFATADRSWLNKPENTGALQNNELLIGDQLVLSVRSMTGTCNKIVVELKGHRTGL